jgi:hypothetical protein
MSFPVSLGDAPINILATLVLVATSPAISELTMYAIPMVCLVDTLRLERSPHTICSSVRELEDLRWKPTDRLKHMFWHPCRVENHFSAHKLSTPSEKVGGRGQGRVLC